ncbi:MAG: hypothetical protein GYB50_18825 [Rhodobacteraceae bacterium]|nr:hypothetical protein [Paracoccaceae bacterium]
MNRTMSHSDSSAMRANLKRGHDASIREADQLVDLARLGMLVHTDDPESLTALFDSLSDDERRLLKALADTGGQSIERTALNLLGNAIRREAHSLMHGSAYAG